MSAAFPTRPAVPTGMGIPSGYRTKTELPACLVARPGFAQGGVHQANYTVIAGRPLKLQCNYTEITEVQLQRPITCQLYPSLSVLRPWLARGTSDAELALLVELTVDLVQPL